MMCVLIHLPWALIVALHLHKCAPTFDMGIDCSLHLHDVRAATFAMCSDHACHCKVSCFG